MASRVPSSETPPPSRGPVERSGRPGPAAPAVVAMIATLAAAPSAHGQLSRDRVPRDELDVRLGPELALTLGMLGVGYLVEEGKRTWSEDMSCPDEPFDRAEERECDSARVNLVDRWVTGLSVEVADDLSDALLVASLLGPLGFAVADAAAHRRTSPGEERLAKDALVIAETYAATYLLTAGVKVLARRLRPFNYDPRFVQARRDADSRLSFPSGHTSLAFAGAATLLVLLDQRFPAEPWAVATASGGLVVASAVGVLRVLAGRHFPTDVLVGAGLGLTIGLVVPTLHRGSGAPRGAEGFAPIGLGGAF